MREVSVSVVDVGEAKFELPAVLIWSDDPELEISDKLADATDELTVVWLPAPGDVSDDVSDVFDPVLDVVKIEDVLLESEAVDGLGGPGAPFEDTFDELAVFTDDVIIITFDVPLVKLFDIEFRMLLEVILCVLLAETCTMLVLRITIEVSDGLVVPDVESYPLLVPVPDVIEDLEVEEEIVVVLGDPTLLDEVVVVDDPTWPRREAREILTQLSESQPKE